MNITRPHVVFDCNILFQAVVRAASPAARCIECVEQNAVSLFISKPIIREFRKIMAYPDIVRRTPHVTDLKITEFLDRLLYRATLVRDPPHVFHYPRDPKDEPYFDLAIACNANFLTSRDKDFLSLTDGHSLEAKELRQRCPGLRILTPEDFLKTILTSL